jgi:two-component system LytT family response regulator
MLRAIIIDDEEAGINTLKVLAQRNADDIRVIAATIEANEGIGLIDDYKPDVVFLDISMPTMSGFELLSKLSFRNFKLIFTTAHRDYAIDAIKSKAFDYLLKPISDVEFSKCINEIVAGREKETVNKDSNLFLEIQVKDGIIYLKQQEIIRLKAARNYTELYMVNGIKHVASKSLGEFEPRLDINSFYRCHKSHIVNLRKVQKFVNHDGFYAMMNDGSMPDVSKSLKDDLLVRLKNI